MGVTERRRRDRENLSQLILEGAREVFARDGHEGLSIRKVAKQIEYSPGTIYLYYKDKDALLLALQEDAFARKAAMFAPLMEVEDPMERILAMGRAYIKHALSAPSDFHLMFVDASSMSALPEGEQSWYSGNKGFQMLQNSIAQGVTSGRFPTFVEPESMAVVLWSMVHGCAMLILSDRLRMLDSEGRGHAVDAMFLQMRRLLTPQTQANA